MRNCFKYLRRNAGSAVFALGTATMLGGYWYNQQQKLNDFQHQIDQVTDVKDKAALVKDRIALENTINGSLVQAFGGLLLVVTAYVSWKNLEATQEKQVTERFTQAINQLGSDKFEVRLGGIYALERIARDSRKDHWTIMEVLISFIQEKSPLRNSAKPTEQESTDLEKSSEPEKQPERITKDVQAALTVIERRNWKNDPERWDLIIDLSKACLEEANLSGAKLVKANLKESNLREANFSGARLRGANLEESNLRKANLSWANLIEANLTGANLIEANLSPAFLERANLKGANLKGANLAGANLEGADLKGANLAGANLEEANLEGADLEGANLAERNLSSILILQTENLTPVQIKAAKNWEKAHYNDDLRQQLGLLPKQES